MITKQQKTEIKTVASLYGAMREHGLTLHEADFSVVWLNMSSGYYRLQGEAVGYGPLLHAWDRLVRCGQIALAADLFSLIRSRACGGVNARATEQRARRSRTPAIEQVSA